MKGIARRAAPALVALALAARPHAAAAQSYARFDVPDSARVAAVRAVGGGFESAWNDLLVTRLRADLAHADSAARLGALGTAVADAERPALGSSIARDALVLAAGWGREGKARRIRGAVAESLAAVALSARDFPAAERRLREALGAYRTLRERRRQAWVLGGLGDVAAGAGALAKADSLYRQALIARRALGDPRLVAFILHDLGAANRRLGRPAIAEPYLVEAHALQTRAGATGPLGATLDELGLLQSGLGRPDSARVLFERALALTAAAGDSVRTADVLIHLAGLLGERGDEGRASALLRRVRGIAKARGDRRQEAQIVIQLAALSVRAGRPADGARLAAEAGALAQQGGDRRGAHAAHLEAGRAWLALGDPGRARAPIEAAAALADSFGEPRLRALAEGLRARLAWLSRDSGGALLHAQRALEAASLAGDSAQAASSAGLLAMLRYERSELDLAQRLYRRVAAIGPAAGVRAQTSADLMLGVILMDTHRYDESEKRLRTALGAAGRNGLEDEKWRALLALADLAERQGDPAAALAHVRRAVSLIDTLRAPPGDASATIARFARRRSAYEALIHRLGKRAQREPGHGDAEEAFAWAERARQESRPATLAEVTARVPKGAALLEYSTGDSSTSLWVIRRGGWSHQLLPSRLLLGPRLEALRRGLADPAASESRATLEAARALYRMLIEPAASELDGIERLIVSPDGPLGAVPFDALLAVDIAAGAPAKKGAWLVERYATSYVPSAAWLEPATPPGTSGLVALGDPRYGDAKVVNGAPLAPLPHTADEVRALVALAGREGCRAWTGAEATRARVDSLRGAAVRVLHLATHADLDRADPGHSGVWLAADASGAPARLEARDLAGLALTAQLVTLSACETGPDTRAPAEGVLGLARAFLTAGTPSVVASLWTVNDASTARLMEEFYTTLLRKRAPRDRALADAKRVLLESPATRAPFHWAPFVLVGAIEPLAPSR